jgi:hypothetical protein
MFHPYRSKLMDELETHSNLTEDEIEQDIVSSPGAAGIVYIVTNPAMPGLIKIGRTYDLESRLMTLSSHSGVPMSFELVYSAEVRDSVYVERAMHATFSMFRIPGKEFFRMLPGPAIAALSLAAPQKAEIDSNEAVSLGVIDAVRLLPITGRKPNQVIIDYIDEFRRMHGRSPTGSEIKEKFPDVPQSTAYDYASRSAKGKI